jgi:hypothetical protein
MPQVLELAREELGPSVSEAPVGIGVLDDGDDDVVLLDAAGLQFRDELCVEVVFCCSVRCRLAIPMKTTFLVRSIPSPVSWTMKFDSECSW